MIFAAPLQNFTLKQRFDFFRKAKTIHDTDSPFVYRFCKYIVEDDRNFYIFPLGRLLYREAKSADRRQFSMAPLTGKRLFRAVHHYKPALALEISAGDGLSAIYQAAAMLSGDLYSIEPDEEQAAFAKKQVSDLGLPNVELRSGALFFTLAAVKKEIKQIDFLFLSTGCPPEKQIAILDEIEPLMHQQTVVAIAAPHQSTTRLASWEQLKADKRTHLSIDLFDLGFLFFDAAFREKQHYRIIPTAQKPWRLGLFR